MVWLFNTLLDLIRDLIWGILLVVIKSFNTSLSLAYDPDTQKWTDNVNFFHDYFNTTSVFGGTSYNILDGIYKDAIMPLAIGLLLWNLCYHLYKSMFSKTSNDVDEPVPLVIRSGVCMFLVMYATKILKIFLYVMGIAFHYLEQAQSDAFVNNLTGKFSFATRGVESNIIGESDTQAGVLLGTAFAPAVFGTLEVVIIVILLIRLIQMLLLYIERYLQFYLLLYFAPLGFSAGASNSTKNITSSYLRMFASSVISLFLTSFGAYVYTFLLVKTVMWDTTDGKYLMGEFMLFGFTLAWYQWFLKLDTYLNSIGLTNVAKQAPLPMLNAMGGMFGAAAMGTALSNVASAAKGAGAALMNQAKKGTGGMAAGINNATKAANGASGAGPMPGAGGIMKGQPATIAGGKVGQWMADHDPTLKALKNIANPTQAAADKANDMINASASSGDVDHNTNTIGSMLRPQEYSKNGKPVNEANSSMAVMSNNGQSFNIAKDPTTGNYYDKNTGATFGKQSYNGNISAVNPISGKFNNTAAIAQSGINTAAKGTFNKAIGASAVTSPLGQQTGYSALNASNGKYQLESKYNPATGNWDTRVLGGSKFNENTGKWEDDNTYSGTDAPVFSSPEEAARVIGNNEKLQNMSADVYGSEPFQNRDNAAMSGSIDFGNSQYQFETRQNPDTGQMETSIVGGATKDQLTGKWSPDNSFANGTYASPAEAAKAIASANNMESGMYSMKTDGNGNGMVDFGDSRYQIATHQNPDTGKMETSIVSGSTYDSSTGKWTADNSYAPPTYSSPSEAAKAIASAKNVGEGTYSVNTDSNGNGTIDFGNSQYQVETHQNPDTGQMETSVVGGSTLDQSTGKWTQDNSFSPVTYNSPEEAAKAIANDKGVDGNLCSISNDAPTIHGNGAGVAESIQNHDANWYTAPIGASNISGTDGMAMNTALETHAVKNKGGVQTSYGSFRSDDAAFQFESVYDNNSGRWSTTITSGNSFNPSTGAWEKDTSMDRAVFHNPADAVEKISQVTGNDDFVCDVYTSKPQQLHSSDVSQSGGFYQALDDRNGITGGMYRSPIPAYTDMKVVQAGNGEIQVVTAGVNGKVVGTDLYHVDASEYKKNPSACYTIGEEHYKVASSSDSANRKASIYTVENGKLKVKDMFSSTLGENNGNV